MAEHTAEVLASLRLLVQSAKSVPMSASCMINRAEALALVDRAAAALAEDLDESQKVTASSLETLQRAQDEAGQIIKAAEDKAAYLVSQSPIMTEARRKAVLLEQKSITEAEALRREADAYVDTRIATFEAGLAKTLSQIKTMRARLASRSGLDDGETQSLPRLAP